MEYNRLSQPERDARIGALIRRLHTLFTGNPLTTNILGQKTTTIDFRDAIDQRRIILIKLPLKKLPDTSRLVGTILISQLHSAIFSYADVAPERRPGFSLYIDEFQNFVTGDIAEMFTEGRKYGVRLVVAHQIRSQLSKELQDVTKGARNKVAFRLMSDDASEMAAYFPDNATSIDPDSIITNASDVLLRRAADFPEEVREFVEVYLKPLQFFRKGHNIEIRNPGNDAWGGVMTFVGDMMTKDAKRISIYVDDPIPYLDSLCYEAMRQQTANLPIPPEVARGFANSGHGFWAFARNCWNSEKLLPGIQYPEKVVVNGQWQGYEWYKAIMPIASQQMYHFVFHLRKTLEYLAQNPLGKVVKSTKADIAGALTRLPSRWAYVAVGDGSGAATKVGTVISADSFPSVTGSEASERHRHIRDQTRATYCVPKGEIHRQPNPPKPAEDVPDTIVRPRIKQDSWDTLPE